MSGGVYGITEVETRAFENLKAWLTENHGTIDLEAIQNNGQLVRAEKKAIMAILLSMDPNEYIFDYWSMGTFVRLVMERLLVFGRLLIDSQATGQELYGPDLFSGETHVEAEGPKNEPVAFAVTESGQKREYLGTLNSWAYHIILNGPTHPATREPIKHFYFKSLDDIKVLPRALRLSRSERLTLSSAIKVARTEPPQISRDQVLAFEFDYSVPGDRSFYDLHHEDDDMPPLIHAVPNALAQFVGPVYIMHNHNVHGAMHAMHNNALLAAAQQNIHFHDDHGEIVEDVFVYQVDDE